MENISEHISYAEAIKSQAAIRAKIDNTPNEAQLSAMKLVAENCFEPLRKYHGKAIAITSFFRNEKLNKLIGGASNSQHMTGEAIDIDADIFNNGITNKHIFDWLKDNVEFDQLINENDYSWVHISYRDKNNRKEILELKNGKYHKVID